jgi:hypothetical protein
LHPSIEPTICAAGPLAALAFELPELADKLSPTELARAAILHHVTTSDTDKAGAEAGPWVEPVLDAVVRFTLDLYKHREGLQRLCRFVEDHGTLELSLQDLLRLSEGEHIDLHHELPMDATANMTALIHAIKRHPDFFSDAIKTALVSVAVKIHTPVLEEA